MADYVLTLPLTDEALERLKTAARAASMEPEAYAVAILDKALASGRDDAAGDFEVREKDAAFVVDNPEPWPPTTPYDTTEAKRRLAEYDRTGKFIEFEDWAADFEAEIEAMLKAKA
ncbi:hypothetical protein [Brevundimonas mediterranea]|uniref:Uncharacterized protein n=1 Tax=Brevundimonas mediterranea TaxID=74329 RepID=A0A7W6A543_9CAUL|nr:hypothetical protein [Brevundimonas mediterranea]MBB3871800.1 hypothetical protein [Brevundimonas mediterranea]